MKYIDEFRDPHLARALIAQIRKDLKQPLRLMEFCGGHTHAILRFGIRTLLPETLTMSSRDAPASPPGPGHAMALARLPGVILTTRRHGQGPGPGSLEKARATGQMFESTLKDAMSRRKKHRTLRYLPGGGFRTAAPGVAASILGPLNWGYGISSYSLHKLTPPAVGHP
jgi:hydrogenase expression/formation protein HypD